MAAPTKIASLVPEPLHVTASQNEWGDDSGDRHQQRLPSHRIRSCGLVSRPALKRTKMAPISATEWMVSLGLIQPRAKGPKPNSGQNLAQD
jgi:hypothetical protein